MSDLIDQHREVVDRIYGHLRGVQQRHDVDWHVRREVDFYGPDDDKDEDTPTGEMDVALVGDDWIDYLEVKTNGRVSTGRGQIRDAREHFEDHGFELTGEVYAVRRQDERSPDELMETILTEMDGLFTPDDLREVFTYQKEFGNFGQLVSGDRVIDVTEVPSGDRAVEDPRYDHRAMLEEGLLEETDDGYERTEAFHGYRADETSVYQANTHAMDVPILDESERDLLGRIDEMADGIFTYQDICDTFDDGDDGRFGNLVNKEAIKAVADLPQEYDLEDRLDQAASQRQLEEDGRYDDDLLRKEGFLAVEDGRYILEEEPGEKLYHIGPDAMF
jgi:hypothetical protein